MHDEKQQRKADAGQGSLSRRLSITLSLVVISTLVIFSLAVVSYNYFRVQRQLDNQLADILELAETSLQTAVWQMDYSSMNDILQAVLINEGVAIVRIIADGTEAAVKMQPQYEGRDFASFQDEANYTIKSVQVRRFDEPVGELQVVISRAAMGRGLLMTLLAVVSLTLMLCSAILVVSGFITRRYIFEPLRKLENHAGVLAAGNFETNIDANGNDEFARLASAFNIMTNRLRISFDTLEQKVKERTADLTEANLSAVEMNQQLRDIGAEVQALLDNSPVGILCVDFDRVIKRVNPEITRITGYTEDELVGSTTRILYRSQEVYEQLGRTNYPILQRTGFCQANSEILRKDGTAVMCYWRGQLFSLDKGMSGVVWAVEDISSRLKMEEELLKIKKLESIGVLAGGIAHDFNNILLAISGNISLALRLTEDNSKIQSLLAAAEKASLRARDLTAKLLTFASGGEPIKATGSLPELVEDSALFVLSGSNVKCEFGFADGLWPVSMDKAQINQVIQNLVLNADQSMKEGGLLRIFCVNKEVKAGDVGGLEEGNYVCITVADTGAGIDKEHIGRVFDPYFSTKEKDSTKGSGLGLSIVHSIVLKHNGVINVSSVPGEGSTFTLYLPAICSEEAAARETVPVIVTGKGRVLVMDDESIIRDVVCEMLELLGYKATQVADGSEALALYDARQKEGAGFDAVIMDLTIPGGMGGVEAVKKLLAIDPLARVIVSSGYSGDSVLENYQALGFCNIASKPYQLQELAQVLSDTLKT